MTELSEVSKRPVQKSSWILLTAVGLLATLSALYVAFTPAGSQTDLATRSWETFASADPEVAAIFVRQLVLAGLSAAGFGLFGIIITLYAFRTGLKWAWFAMWLFPLLFGGGAIRMLVESYDVGYWYVVLALLSAIGLLIPVRRFF
jgi:hypothetical protein